MAWTHLFSLWRTNVSILSLVLFPVHLSVLTSLSYLSCYLLVNTSDYRCTRAERHKSKQLRKHDFQTQRSKYLNFSDICILSSINCIFIKQGRATLRGLYDFPGTRKKPLACLKLGQRQSKQLGTLRTFFSVLLFPSSIPNYACSLKVTRKHMCG